MACSLRDLFDILRPRRELGVIQAFNFVEVGFRVFEIDDHCDRLDQVGVRRIHSFGLQHAAYPDEGVPQEIGASPLKRMLVPNLVRAETCPIYLVGGRRLHQHALPRRQEKRTQFMRLRELCFGCLVKDQRPNVRPFAFLEVRHKSTQPLGVFGGACLEDVEEDQPVLVETRLSHHDVVFRRRHRVRVPCVDGRLAVAHQAFEAVDTRCPPLVDSKVTSPECFRADFGVAEGDAPWHRCPVAEGEVGML